MDPPADGWLGNGWLLCVPSSRTVWEHFALSRVSDSKRERHPEPKWRPRHSAVHPSPSYARITWIR